MGRLVGCNGCNLAGRRRADQGRLRCRAGRRSSRARRDPRGWARSGLTGAVADNVPSGCSTGNFPDVWETFLSWILAGGTPDIVSKTQAEAGDDGHDPAWGDDPRRLPPTSSFVADIMGT